MLRTSFMGRPRVIGIDLGTTNSCAAYVEDSGQKAKLIPYRSGEYTIPSIYAIDEKGNELVGHDAKRQWQLNPKRTIYGSKRLLGRQYDRRIADQIHDYFAYDIHESEEKREVEIAVGGQMFTLQQVASKILLKIKDVASDHLQAPITQAVVTVPAYFTDRQRQAVKEAGRLVDLDVVRIINEPTAAALAFGVGRALDRELLAVYDLGGGTFDISLIEVRDRVFEVKATGGDIFLGGVDWDNRIVEWVLEEFALVQPRIDLRKDLVAMQRIRDLAERVKIDLSTRSKAAFNIPFITSSAAGEPVDLSLDLTRERLDELTEDFVTRTVDTCKKVCADAGIAPESVDHVLLVGGMTRAPAVQKVVTELFGKQPSKQVNPDEAVAIGAAMFAYSFEDDSNSRVQVLDVIPMAIGIEDANGRLRHIFERNEAVPNLKTMTFTTSVDNQKSLKMRLYQGDHETAEDNELLGEFDFSGIRTAPAGSVRVKVAFNLSLDGTLGLSARDTDTGAEMSTAVSLGARKEES